MATIGGTFTAQNKPLPGVYINVVSTPAVSAGGNARGTVAVALPLNWGKMGVITELKADAFEKNSLKLFGYSADSPQLLALREIFKNAGTALVYRISASDSAMATNAYATALYAGSRGNDIKVAITANVNNDALYDVSTYLGNVLVDLQTVSNAAELKANEYVSFKNDSTLSLTAATPLSGGTDGASLTVNDYQSYLDKLEAHNFNALACPTTSAEVVELYKNYTKRLRNDLGVRFQLIAYHAPADYEGAINVDNTVDGVSDAFGIGEHGLVYWVAGAAAGCALNRSLTNKAYDGELVVNTDYTAAQLAANKAAGKFSLYNANGTVRVLDDSNSFVSYADNKGKEFALNQVIRATDALCNDISAKFADDYLGIIPNNTGGRTSLWTDICNIIQSYVKNGIFADFSTDMVVVEAGEELGDVVCRISGLTIAYTMSKLYLTISIR